VIAFTPLLFVAITFTSFDKSTLSGTLSFPNRAAAVVPAVVLLGANGPEDRDERVGATAVFDRYAAALNAGGFAVFRYDNRGVGESMTATQAQSVRRQNFIDDAAAAIAVLAQEQRIDARRIYALGLSEGAETAMAAALAGAPIRALVLVGPLSVPYAQALRQSVAAASADVRARVDLLQRLPYFRSYETIDPRREIAFVAQPMLAVRGERDTQTPESDFAGLVGAARAAGRRIDVLHGPHDDHFLLQLSTTEEAKAPNYPLAHEVDPQVMSAIVSWLRIH